MKFSDKIIGNRLSVAISLRLASESESSEARTEASCWPLLGRLRTALNHKAASGEW